jgi:hypothetical protein
MPTACGVTSVARIPKLHTFYSKEAANIISNARKTWAHFWPFEGKFSQHREFFTDSTE